MSATRPATKTEIKAKYVNGVCLKRASPMSGIEDNPGISKGSKA